MTDLHFDTDLAFGPCDREDCDTGTAGPVGAVLRSESSYDDLSDAQQAVVRAEWDRRVEASREAST